VALAPTQYARSGGADIAYQVIGEGPRDVVVALDWASHLETMTELPQGVEFFLSLARFARVLLFDMRGIGMSGPVEGGIPVEVGWTTSFLSWMLRDPRRRRSSLRATRHRWR
jgi:pimeloyl-ACP methyl ester carboxylesterase